MFLMFHNIVHFIVLHRDQSRFADDTSTTEGTDYSVHCSREGGYWSKGHMHQREHACVRACVRVASFVTHN